MLGSDILRIIAYKRRANPRLSVLLVPLFFFCAFFIFLTYSAIWLSYKAIELAQRTWLFLKGACGSI